MKKKEGTWKEMSERMEEKEEDGKREGEDEAQCREGREGGKLGKWGRQREREIVTTRDSHVQPSGSLGHIRKGRIVWGHIETHVDDS